MRAQTETHIKKIIAIEEMLPHLELIRQLSPQLNMEQYKAMLQVMVPHNYYQAALYTNGKCIAVTGYWIGTKLYSGKYLEIDNFVVDEAHRNKGIGKMLIDWLAAEGLRNDCQLLMLDAYVENFKAHHFYYREGFFARGFHYLKPL